MITLNIIFLRFNFDCPAIGKQQGIVFYNIK